MERDTIHSARQKQQGICGTQQSGYAGNKLSKESTKKGAWGAQWGVKAELQWNVAFSMLTANF
jgi:hypothetical protein